MQWLAEICVKRPVFATMLVMSLVVVGAFSFLSLGVDLFPKIDFPTITVTVANPGSAPQEIETEITDKIEEAVNTISGIDELRSSSIEGVSQVFVQFVLEKDVNVAAQEVENRVQTVIPKLPETAKQPTVQKLDTDAAPVLRISISAPASLREVTETAKHKIKERIESINGVGQITIIGGQERQINVWVDPDKMRSYNVTPAEVSGALKIQNMEFPSGRLDEGQKETSVRTVGKIQKPEEFNDVVVATRGGYQVKVKDLGYTEDGGEEIRSEARLNGQPAVTMIVSKQSGQNTVAVAREIKARLKEIEPTLPKGYQMRVIGDNSIFIENSLRAIEEHLILGSILASIVVFLFLWSFRSTFIAAMAIPTSIISTFALVYAMGYTLNQITMLADADGRYRHRRRDRCAREHLSLRRGKGNEPVPGGYRGHARDRPGRYGDDAFADGGVRPDRLYAGHRRQIHVVVRPYGVVCGRRFADRVVHDDADARGQADQEKSRESRVASCE